MVKYKLNHRHKTNVKDGLWLAIVLVILVVITLWGVDMIEYVSSHNILKGQF